MENYINQAVDIPKMVNDKIPVNFNTMLDDSERNMSNWVGMFYKIASLVFILGVAYALLNPLWNDGLESGSDLVAQLLTMAIWFIAMFPLSQIIRSAGDSLGSSDSGHVKYIFRDLVLANIKMVGHFLALGALITAFCMVLSWILDMTVGGDIGSWLDSVTWMYELPMAVTADFATWVGFDGVSELINGFFGDVPGISSSAGEGWNIPVADPTKIDAHSYNGLIACFWAFAKVVAVLAQLYVSMAIYRFLFGLGSAFMNWFKSPYIPTRSV